MREILNAKSSQEKQCVKTFWITNKECVACNGRNKECGRFEPMNEESEKDCPGRERPGI